MLELSLGELKRYIRGFLSEYQKSRSDATIGTYRRSLNEFERWFVLEEGRFNFTTEGVEQYKAYLTNERELSGASVSTYLTALRRLCQYLVDIEAMAANPALAVKGNRRPHGHTRKMLAESDVEKLFDAVNSSQVIVKRDRAIIHLMLYAGLSEIECARADRKDLDQTLLGWSLRVQGKGRTDKDQQIELDPPVVEALNSYLEARRDLRPDSPLFVTHSRKKTGDRIQTRTMRKRINMHFREAGIKRPGITPHSLTHTAARLWLNDGHSVEQVRRRMRHGSLDTTMIYLENQGLVGED